jgi:uncharacterized protein YbcV (DUF1398 family)
VGTIEQPYNVQTDDGSIAVQQGSLIAFSNRQLAHKVAKVTNPTYVAQQYPQSQS